MSRHPSSASDDEANAVPRIKLRRRPFLGGRLYLKARAQTGSRPRIAQSGSDAWASRAAEGWPEFSRRQLSCAPGNIKGMADAPPGNELAATLELFDRVAVNLDNLQHVWEEMTSYTHVSGFVINTSDPRYDELMRKFDDLAAGLPPIHGCVITVRPMPLHAAGQWRMDAIDVPEALPGLQRELEAPGEAIAEYRHRLRKERRALVRRRADTLTTHIDSLLSDLVERHPCDASSVKDDEDWITMEKTFRELFRLLGKDELSGTRVTDLQRHLHFGLGVDLHDIANHDWPDVKPRIERALYADREPLPVGMADLGTLAEARPAGPVPTELDFSKLDDEKFERLVFSLLTTTEGYENATWLMETRAPDRGRDLSVDRVNVDALTGATHDRVIVQCKAWKKSISPTECVAALAPLPLWEPPPIDVLVIATTGRFSADAVAWIEKHNNEGKRPRMWPWANSTLELMLASRSDLVARFDLRP